MQWNTFTLEMKEQITLGHGGSFEPISESNKSETKDHIALFNLPEASEQIFIEPKK